QPQYSTSLHVFQPFTPSVFKLVRFPRSDRWRKVGIFSRGCVAAVLGGRPGWVRRQGWAASARDRSRAEIGENSPISRISVAEVDRCGEGSGGSVWRKVGSRVGRLPWRRVGASVVEEGGGETGGARGTW